MLLEIYLLPDVERIIIDSKPLFKKTQKYLEDISPSLLERLELFKLKSPLFESFGIESEIEKLLKPKAWLKSGAYLIIEKTEAMVVVMLIVEDSLVKNFMKKFIKN